MKHRLKPGILFALLLYVSGCNNDDFLLLQTTFVKEIPSAKDMNALGLVQLEDGNYILAGYHRRDPAKGPREPGHIIKMNGDGQILWSKTLTNYNRTLFRVLSVPGKGFLVFGIADHFDNSMVLSLYNSNGDSLSTHFIIGHGNNSWNAPFDIIRLSNGNYALIGGDVSWNFKAYLTILDENFNKVSTLEFAPPPGYYSLSFKHLHETPESELAITTSLIYISPANDSTIFLTGLLRTDLNGNQKSLELIHDSEFDETVNNVSSNHDGIFTISSRKPFNNLYGTIVNYPFNFNSFELLVSGRINIRNYSDEGKYLERHEINNYPGNGSIHSLRKTSDGGFIACGTVNQSNSPVVNSLTKMYVLKLHANLGIQWSKIIQTSYPAFGVDALQTSDGGFLVSGYYRSWNERYEMLVLKMDANGNY